MEDVHNMFELVERPLDMSYACRTLSHLHNDFLVVLTSETFALFLHAAMKVDRRDLITFAIQNAEKLGFVSIDSKSRAFAEGKSSWYKIEDGQYLPLEGNEKLNSPELVKERRDEESELLRQLDQKKHISNIENTRSPEEELAQLEKELAEAESVGNEER